VNQPSPGQFLDACEATGPLQFFVELQGRSEVIRRTVPLPFAVAGYDKRTDITLDRGGRISRRHAYLQVVEGRLWCIDLNSRSGTLLEPPDGTPGLLDPRRSIRIGPYSIRAAAGCRDDEDDSSSLENPLSSGIADSSSFPRVGLEVSQGGARQPMRLVDRVLTLVGRSAHCRLRLIHPLVSRTHCALLHTSSGFWLIDLLGRDGTRVNEAPVRWALLDDVDELRIGPFLIRVRILDRAGRAPANHLLPPAQSAAPSLVVQGGLPVEVNGVLTSSLQLSHTSSALAAAGGGRATESLLLPLVSQFSMMTHQMFDQFQQALMMMVQTFSRLHRDQVQLIRQELNQLHELTRELQEIQKELGKRPPAPTRTASEPSGQNRATLPPTPSAPVAPSVPRNAEPARPRDQRGPASPLSPPAPMSSTASKASADPSAVPLQRPTAEVHAWLTQRLAVLQEERQTRWQKILNALTGKSGEEVMP
jgi:pSer/pThr/pTyr-binding forkhead associated (FHA) protein